MTEYHIFAGLFGRIYAGTLTPKKDGKPQMWRNKSDVTEEALCAVRDYMVDECTNEEEGKMSGGYEWKRKDGKKVALTICVKDSEEDAVDCLEYNARKRKAKPLKNGEPD